MRPRKSPTKKPLAESQDQASMGPRPCGRGNVETFAGIGRGNAASMGPRPCGRGNVAARIAHPTAYSRLQWGRGLAAAEIWWCCSHSSQRHTCFNGAAALRPRKLPVTEPSQPPGNALQWGRGLAAAEIGSRISIPPRLKKLQWGRGLAAAEMIDAQFGHALTGDASMGPRPCGRGNAAWPHPARYTRCPLQWGRGLAAVEITLPIWPAVSTTSGFNGAAALRPWKCDPHRNRHAPRSAASMGPRPCGRGNRGPGGSAGLDGKASMGPRPCGRGKWWWSSRWWSSCSRFNGAAALRPWKYPLPSP